MENASPAQHRQIIWLNEKPEGQRPDSDPVEKFVVHLVDLVKELGQKKK